MNIQGTRMFLLQKRLKHIKLQLKDWNKKEHVVAKKAVEGKMQEINQALIIDGFDETRNDQATKCNQEWENLCKQEEIFWRQNQGFNGSKKEKEILDFSTDPLWRTEFTTEFQ